MNYTALIVDDEALERDAIALLISRSGRPFSSLKATNGQEAVAMIHEHHVDVVFMDIQMPVLSGLEAARQIKAFDQQIIIVFLTAWGTFDFAKEAIRLGAKDYLVKPTSQETINATLDKILAILSESDGSEKRIQNMLGAFTRDFFASLKYGTVDEDKTRQYFHLLHIHLECGFSIVVSNLTTKRLQEIQEGDPIIRETNLCYYASFDRITILLFTERPLIVTERCETAIRNERDIIQGIGIPFRNLKEIPHSIHSASLARLSAGQKGFASLRYQEQQGFDTEIVKQQIATAISKAQDDVLTGELQQARQEAHAILDLAQELPDPKETIYQSLVVLTYNLKAGIPYFFRADPEKESIREMEVYLMDCIDAAVAAVNEDNKSKYGRSFAMVDRYLHLHYADQVGVNTLAEMMGINPSYFSKLFKEYFHKPYVEYLTDIRLEKATVLLLDGETVQSTAAKTGFSDHTYFARVFKQKYGVSPTDYKRTQG
ncbi:MAG: response regulator [Sphaerochaetaceae bacterium]